MEDGDPLKKVAEACGSRFYSRHKTQYPNKLSGHCFRGAGPGAGLKCMYGWWGEMFYCLVQVVSIDLHVSPGRAVVPVPGQGHQRGGAAMWRQA